VKVEAKHTSQSLQEKWITKPPEKFLPSMLVHYDFTNRPAKKFHPAEQPRWAFTAVQWKFSNTNSLHVNQFVFSTELKLISTNAGRKT